MLNLCGLNKKNTIIIESLYGIFISLIGNFIGYIFVLIISSVINLDSFFMFMIPSPLKGFIGNYQYVNMFPWYIVFISLFMFMISIFIICQVNYKKMVNSEALLTKDCN